MSEKTPQGVSVYDFLYNDARRVASFLAQFHDHGLLQGVKATETAARTSSERFDVSGGANMLVGKAGIAAQTTESSEEREAAENSYDPFWRNALRFLDALEASNMIQRDLAAAQMGQIVLVRGALAAFDFGILKEAWKLSAVRNAAKKSVQPAPAGTREERRRMKVAAADGQSSIEAGLELIGIIPHVIQATIASDAGTVWCTLKDDALTGTSADLLTKHGARISGEWHMLAILDALPEPESGDYALVLDQLIAASSLNLMGGEIVAAMLPFIRPMLGRPTTAFGATPLLIFRETGQRPRHKGEIETS